METYTGILTILGTYRYKVFAISDENRKDFFKFEFDQLDEHSAEQLQHLSKLKQPLMFRLMRRGKAVLDGLLSTKEFNMIGKQAVMIADTSKKLVLQMMAT